MVWVKWGEITSGGRPPRPSAPLVLTAAIHPRAEQARTHDASAGSGVGGARQMGTPGRWALQAQLHAACLDELRRGSAGDELLLPAGDFMCKAPVPVHRSHQHPHLMFITEQEGQWAGRNVERDAATRRMGYSGTRAQTSMSEGAEMEMDAAANEVPAHIGGLHAYRCLHRPHAHCVATLIGVPVCQGFL